LGNGLEIELLQFRNSVAPTDPVDERLRDHAGNLIQMFGGFAP